jgi:hypothetical protein
MQVPSPGPELRREGGRRVAIPEEERRHADLAAVRFSPTPVHSCGRRSFGIGLHLREGAGLQVLDSEVRELARHCIADNPSERVTAQDMLVRHMRVHQPSPQPHDVQYAM